MDYSVLTWIGIALCISQSALFSGLNLAVFSLGRLRLEAESASGNYDARTVLALRDRPNEFLSTILWGNVGINVLLTLLSNSVMAGVSAFMFSTFLITIMGEIVPQAYFSRHAVKMASRFAPVLWMYRGLLYPMVKPTSLALDYWLGKETVAYYREAEIKELLRRHMMDDATEVSRVEAIGALNFLTIDDIPIEQEGVTVDPTSILSLPILNGVPQFPSFRKSSDDPFLRQVNASDKAWVVITDEHNEPHYIMDADGFLRHALLTSEETNPFTYCHRPIVVRNRKEPLGQVVGLLNFDQTSSGDHLIADDAILLWTKQPRLITGADLLGRLFRGIARRGRGEAED
jgi:metal transporter CNNM